MYYLTLCCIAKDENAFIGEWVAYHALRGVERIILYDNGSRIPLAETVAPLADRIPLVVRSFPGQAQQLAAYTHCLETDGPHTKWLAFIDVDEFFLPRDEDDLRVVLTDFEDFAGLGANWVMFGSTGHETRPSGLQIEHFTHRAALTSPVNHHIKSIVQPRLTLRPLSPHHFAYKPDRYCVNERGFPLPGPYGPHHEARLRINHYFFRSRQDFREKIERGRGDMPTSRFRHSMQDFENQLKEFVIEDREIVRHATAVQAFLDGETSSIKYGYDLNQESERVVLLLERKRIDLAEVLSRRLLITHGDKAETWSLRALVLALAGRHTEAMTAIARSLRIEQSVENIYQLFRIQTLAGDRDDALCTARYLWWRLHSVDADLCAECGSILAAIQRVL